MIGVLIIAIWVVLAIYGISKKNYISINILIAMSVLQNFVLIIASPYISQSSFNLFILVKEVYVLFLIVMGYLQKRKLTKIEFGCFASIAIVVLYGILYRISSITAVLASVRQLYLPFLFLLLGCVSFSSPKEIIKSIRFFVKAMCICTFFGWIEMILGDSFWIKIGYSSYAALKSIESGLTPDTGVSGAFYSWDFGIRLRRMGSFLAEPVILGQLLAFALIMAFLCTDLFKRKNQKYIAVCILALGLLSTLAKGGVIIALFSFAFVIGKTWKNNKLSFFAKASFLIILVSGIIYTFANDANGATHIGGLFDNLKYLPSYPFGRGIGVVGNLGYNYGGRINLIVNGESFIGAAIGQMGIIAIIIYTYFYINLFKALKKSAKSHLCGMENIVLWLNIGLFLTSLANNTAISFTSCFIYYIVAGGIYRTHLENRKS